MADVDIDEEAVVMFCAATDSEADVARGFLAISDNNVETAVAMFFEYGAGYVTGGGSGGGGASGVNGVGVGVGGDSGVRAPGRMDDEDGVRAAIAPKHDTLVGHPGFVSHGFDYESENELLLDSVRDPSAVAARVGLRNISSSSSFASAASSSSRQRGGDGHSNGAFAILAGSGDPKRDKLARMFAEPSEIMFRDSFDMAREYGKKHSKWILVTLTDRTEFACEAQKRDLWNVDIMREMISASFVFLFYDADSSEGRQHMSFYKVQGLPYFAIIDPRTGESMKVWRTTPKKGELLQEFATFLDLYSLESHRAPAPSKRKANASVGELTEEEQMALAIAASMETPAGGGSSSSAKKMQLDDDVMDITEEAESAEDRLLDEWASIPSKAGPEPQTGDITRVQFKLPDGSKFVRKFLKTEKVKAMFSFVKENLASNDMLDKFELLNFRDALYSKLDLTLQEAGVVNASVIVELKD
ncbi:hypothetical protein BC830DRAFT_522818 [Chytriomyces sp. MP71]|nr:hypothetical protein BC830DRAFT_522818 [Chytriomyces sp. MP71]